MLACRLSFKNQLECPDSVSKIDQSLQKILPESFRDILETSSDDEENSIRPVLSQATFPPTAICLPDFSEARNSSPGSAKKTAKSLGQDSIVDILTDGEYGAKVVEARPKRKRTMLKSSGIIESGESGSENTSSSDKDWNDRHLSKKKKPKARNTRRSSASSETLSEMEREEGELDDAVKSSDSDSDSVKFVDEYDANLMGDEEDRKRLEAMTEKEREEELFRRLERREMLKTRFEIEKKLRRAKRKGEKSAARDVTAEIDLGERSSTKKSQSVKLKTNGESSSDRKTATDKAKESKQRAMQDLLAKREEKKKLAEQESKKPPLKVEEVFKSSSSDVSSTSSSSASESEESEEEDTRPKQIQTKMELDKIRMSRYKMSK
ncbi:unnamed protein product [Soboliphyme baturini]|uniref:NUC153 domain-containing protein n=1 Tax=Soboliphyme baturini TaxID=241478 RepID=A0A183IRY8_9BILA|nr:unnamed protein product [Soboliphyme baturini]